MGWLCNIQVSDKMETYICVIDLMCLFDYSCFYKTDILYIYIYNSQLDDYNDLKLYQLIWMLTYM